MPLEIWRCQLWRLAANLPLIFVCLLCARHSVAQEIAPDCSAADLDISYRFLNNPPNEKVIVEFRNTSQGACTLRPGPGIGFGDYWHLHSIRTTDCHNCDVDGKSRSVPPITISVGQATHLIVGWETTRVGGIACQEGGTLNSYVNGDLKHGFVIWAGNLLGDVCSVVRVDSYYPGTFRQEETDFRISETREQQRVAIKLSPSGDIFYGDDSFWLYADISDPDEILTLDAHSCPPVFLKTRAFDGTSWLEQIGGQCQVTDNGPGLGRSIRLKIWTMGRGAFAGTDTRVEVSALLSAPRAPEVEMVTSNSIVLHRVDSAAVERKWGPPVKGLAVSLFLDKQEYALGEDIPLRLAVENFSADSDVWSGELPCDAGLTVDVRDLNGRAVQSVNTSPCTGHGWTQGYSKGKIVPVSGLTLSGEGHLPDRPGDYILMATWQPFAGGSPQFGEVTASSSSGPSLPYAVVHSLPVTFRVVAQRR